MRNGDGSTWIVYNGEIYNHPELKRELEAKGHHFRTNSDTETIVHGYEEYGTSFANKLNGMFTIAIWDTRQQTLLLYRDRFGVKPLFYSALSNNLVFGSEIKSILVHPDIDRSRNPEAVPQFLSHGYVPTPGTFYRRIRKLPPACLEVVSAYIIALIEIPEIDVGGIARIR